MTEYGIDISHYQALVDAHQVAAAGVSFAWVKATQGAAQVDTSFPGKVAQLRAAGITVGAYHYLDGADPATQAKHFTAVAGAAGCLAPGALAPMLDVEYPVIRSFANNVVRGFLDSLFVGLCVVYGNLDWWTHALSPTAWGGAVTAGVIARYNDTPGQPGWTAWPRLAVHQYTDTGSIPGIPGAVDRDVLMPGWTLDMLRLPGAPVPSATTTGASATAPSDSTDTWTVRAGDTLGRIASAWDVTVAELAAVNGIPDANLIDVGQVIHRPGTTHAAPAPIGASRYVVRPGDTLSGIALREHTTVTALAALNHLANPDRIAVDQVLVLPTTAPAAGATGTRRYTVKAGDTLGTIAARLHTPGGWPTLQHLNHLANPNHITVGETLVY